MRRQFLLTILLVSSTILLYAQKTFTGTVKDSKTNQPLAGVSVKLKTGKLGTTTNNEGVFRINAVNGDVLEITIIGYRPQTITVSDQSDISVLLEQGSAELTEIVFVGSRGSGRAKTETPVPVDVIKINQVGVPTARMDITSVLNY